MSYYLLWASQGEYSDRSEWPIALYETKDAAEAAVKYGEGLFRQLYGGGYLPYEVRQKRLKSPLGRQLAELIGEHVSIYDELSLSCCELEMRQAPAQAGEAGTAETAKTGSVHEHAVPEGNAP